MAADVDVLDAELTAAVETTLRAFLIGESGALREVDPALGDFAQVAQDCVLGGGKRLRPRFAYWGWHGLAGADESLTPILPALAALELLHTFALVHDDVMDGSATRRGRPTAHRTLTERHAASDRTGDADRFGQAGAILVGDLCLVWADRLLGHTALPAGTVLAARRCYDQMRVETVAGQYLDVLGETDTRNWSVDRALRVARYKTASYTVAHPLLFGAALAGHTPGTPATEAYLQYGLAVGEAFQLRDDLLGVYGDPATTGKPAGDDLRTGKPTALLMLARELATGDQRAELDAAPTRLAGATDAEAGDEVARLAELVAATGAVRHVQKMIDERVAEALTVLRDAPVRAAARQALTGLATAATQRQA
ncbi:polyprenyl synthetase family protein [Solwaraspora sp. WMMD1047]|uniref:polyprenyl synthetase family protein n=1 Tax=Solwaraspora sp. WMMD1047 TaxID=3016102 RepID=UPI0024178E83|nr:polyprenyl synthetase family protein [Solwaraspora sp. WMMD1047]MDG4827820.1 polyprenyl synthetase family protein [Solwaraspora sp. WMMD1047]